MRDGQYVVELVSLDDSRVYEEQTIGSKTYVVAEPGQEYYVRIKIYRDSQGKYPASYLRLGLYIDGYDVQYWKRVEFTDPFANSNSDSNSSNSSRNNNNIHSEIPVVSKFWGFKNNTSDIHSFTFAEPVQSLEPYRTHSKPLGSIKLVIYEAKVTTGVFNNTVKAGEIPTSIGNVYEGKKFWKQASVTTTAGRLLDKTGEQFLPVVRWTKIQ